MRCLSRLGRGAEKALDCGCVAPSSEVGGSQIGNGTRAIPAPSMPMRGLIALTRGRKDYCGPAPVWPLVVAGSFERPSALAVC
jgi:hypothetical protein